MAEKVCTFACEDIPKIARVVRQARHSPIAPRVPGRETPYSAPIREDFKLGVVMDKISGATFNAACCKWNPARGLVRIYDRRFYPDDPSNCTPAPENGEFCWGERGDNRAPYTAYNFSCLPLFKGQRVYLSRDYLLGAWVAKPVDTPGRVRVRIIEEIDPPQKEQCYPAEPGAQSAPLGSRASRFSWMNYSSGIPSQALLHDTDGSIDKVDRYTLLHLQQNAGGGAPLPPTTTSSCVTGDSSGIVGQCVFWYDDEGTLVGEVTILTAVYDQQTNDTCLTWEPALPEPPGDNWKMRVTAKCSGPHTVQVLGYTDSDCGDCSLTECEDYTMEVYSNLPCTLEADTEWEAVLYSGCGEEDCGRYFLKDVREPFVHGIASEPIAPFDPDIGLWCSGLINVYELDPFNQLEGCQGLMESQALEDDCTTTTQIRVFNGCPFEVNSGDRVQAHLKGCNYIITSVCCP